MKERTVVLLLCVILTAAYSFGSHIYFRTAEIEFSDSARFGWDTWEYQSMAANFAAGHGLKFGAVEEFGFYKFTQTGNQIFGDAGMRGYENFLDTGSRGGSYNFYRTPGYPVFIGLLYKIFGVSPKAARVSQVFLVILVAGFLPFIGFAYWRLTGFSAGVLAGAVLMSTYVYIHGIQDELLAEPLIMFCAFAGVMMFVIWERSKSIVASAVLGVVMGGGILVKGSLFFVPVVTLVYLLHLLKCKKFSLAGIAAFVFGLSMVVLSWSMYVSVKEGRPVFISTEGGQLLLETNSVVSKDGTWHAKPIDSFYETPEIKPLPGPVKVFLYYLNHKELLPSIFINKINAGFDGFLFFKTALLFLLYEMALNTLKFYGFEGKSKAFVYLRKAMSLIASMWMAFVVCVVILKLNLHPTAVLLFANFVHLMPNATLLIYIFIIYLFISYAFTKRAGLKIPASFVIFTLNFLLIALIFYGHPRHTKVIDFIFMLMTMQAVIDAFFTAAAVNPGHLESNT